MEARCVLSKLRAKSVYNTYLLTYSMVQGPS
jgi:hypothetical protein